MVDSTQSKAGSRNPFRYREYFLDEETGLYYLGSRYYDPVVGRFISTDGLGLSGQTVVNAAIGGISETLSQIGGKATVKEKVTRVVGATIIGGFAGRIGGKGIKAKNTPYKKILDIRKSLQGDVKKAISNPKLYKHQINNAIKISQRVIPREVKKTIRRFGLASIWSVWGNRKKKKYIRKLSH